jgi:serine phosphatase RsbU (regulator of sigma subunit)
MAEQISDARPRLSSRAAQMFLDILDATHLSRASDVAGLVAEKASAIGAEDVVLYLADYELTSLIPLPAPTAVDRGVLRIDGTIGGRVFATVSVLDADVGRPDRRKVWVPLIDGTDRLGVMELTVPSNGPRVDEAMLTVCERYAHLVAQLIVSKNLYGDTFELIRRRQPMSLGAEMQYKLLPPLTFATKGLVLAGAVEPAYNAGGDSFDYAVNGSIAHIAVFDAMGHGLSAAITANVAVAAYRNSRRRMLDLPGTYAAISQEVGAEFDGERFVTAVLAELNLQTGVLSWISAGHLPPLLIRDGKLVKTLQADPSTPLGTPFDLGPAAVATEALQPGDQVLLYTDGLTEARTADGAFFTVERLAQFLERQASAGLPTPETLRRLRHAVLEYQSRRLQDDATALLVEWGEDAERALVPLRTLGSETDGSPG